jgi:hypothetical protein
MLRMLGRLMWIAVGAVGVKALEEAQRQRRNGGQGRGATGNGGGKRTNTRRTSTED